MSNRENIWQELMEISPVVANLQRTPVYSVPYLYFETLAENILLRVKNEATGMYGNSTEMPYTVPQDYFENLTGGILQKIRQQAETPVNEVYEELQEIAPLLNTISKKTVYSVPEFYFENNAFAIPKEAAEPARVVRMSSVRKFVTYAAAAAITGIVAVSSFLYLKKEKVETSGVHAGPMVTAAVKTLSDAEIIDYLESNTPAIDVTSASYKTPHTDANIDAFLDAMTDEEIQQYLNETAEPGDKKIKDLNS